MEDDHVDRPGVEVRQRMKLTGTNSSIGLIVLIDYAHRTKFDVPDLCPDAPWRCGRPAKRLATASGLYRCHKHPQPEEVPKDVFKTSEREPNSAIRYWLLPIRSKPSFSKQQSCALPTWWLWRGGCTRSLSEHGRETPLRPWYFVLRRGRVGRCQVCKTQL